MFNLDYLRNNKNLKIIYLFTLIPFICLLLFLLGFIKSYTEFKNILGYLHEIFLIFLGIFMFFLGFNYFKKKRLIENIPTSKVRSVAMGLCELKGKAIPKILLKSPITLTDCVYYRFMIEQEKKGGRGRRYWVVVTQDYSKEYFYLEDETGKILIDPLDAEVILPIDYRYVGIIDRFYNSKMRYTEWYIRPGEDIYVLGSVKKLRDEIQERKQKLIKRLNEIKQDQNKLKEIDTNKDGRISIEEWDKIVEKIQQEILEEDIKNSKLITNEYDLVVSKDDIEKILIISDRSEKEVVKKFFLKSILLTYSGMLIVIVIFISLIARMGFLPKQFIIPWENFYRR